MEIRKKVLLIIMDGLGVAPASEGNAVVLATRTTSLFPLVHIPTYILVASERR